MEVFLKSRIIAYTRISLLAGRWEDEMSACD